MIIDELKEQKKNKNRFNIYSENAFIGALNLEAIVKYKIKAGTEISSDAFDGIIAEDNERYAFEKALNHISYQRRTEQEVRVFLKGKEIDEKAIAPAIQKLKEYGYINDMDYALAYAKNSMQEKNTGLRAVAYKLKQKGIAKEILEEVLNEFSGDEEMQHARALYEMLDAKYAKDEGAKRKAKIIRNMAAKGFDYETIQCVLKQEE